MQSPSNTIGNASSRSGGIMKSSAPTGAQKQSLPLEDALNILLQGFIKGLCYTQNFILEEQGFNTILHYCIYFHSYVL